MDHSSAWSPDVHHNRLPRLRSGEIKLLRTLPIPLRGPVRDETSSLLLNSKVGRGNISPSRPVSPRTHRRGSPISPGQKRRLSERGKQVCPLVGGRIAHPRADPHQALSGARCVECSRPGLAPQGPTWGTRDGAGTGAGEFGPGRSHGSEMGWRAGWANSYSPAALRLRFPGAPPRSAHGWTRSLAREPCAAPPPGGIQSSGPGEPPAKERPGRRRRGAAHAWPEAPAAAPARGPSRAPPAG